MAKNLAPLGCKIGFLVGTICPAVGMALAVGGALYLACDKVSDVVVEKIEEKKKREAGK